jgi:hypothetical protein
MRFRRPAREFDMLDDQYDARADAVVTTAFEIGYSSGMVGPLHLLVALSESDGDAAALLRPGVTGGLRSIVFADLESMGTGAMVDFRARQITGSAQQWAAADNTKVSPAHLLVALAEQAAPDVVDACTTAAIDLAAARDCALHELGWSHPRMLEPLEPAGTMDRPPLPLSDLPEAVWAELRDRQRRLPIRRLRHAWQAYALCHNEDRMARRIVNRHDVSNDERYSLLHYHFDTVKGLAAEAVPEILPPPGPRPGFLTSANVAHLHRRHRFVRRHFAWLGGWACWFGNRRAGLRDRWFRLTWRY